jgi:hypothetical protein
VPLNAVSNSTTCYYFGVVPLRHNLWNEEKNMKRVFWSTLMAISLFPTLVTNPALSADPAELSAFAHPTVVHEIAEGHSPRIAAESSGNFHVVFESFEPGSKVQDIFYTESSDGGVSWAAPVDVSKTPGASSHPDIALEKSGAVDVVWGDTTSGESSPDIFFSRSSDGGKTWTSPADISNTPGVSAEPTLAIGPDSSIHVVWSDTSKGEKNKDIYYTSSSDGGKTWAKDPLLPAEDISKTPGMSSQPAITVDEEGSPNVVWLDGTPGETHPDIYYMCKENGAWTRPVNISHSPRVSDHPSIACGAKGKVFIVWQDYSQKPTAPDIWCAVGGKNGHFAKPINISNSPGVSAKPSVAADAKGNVVFVWTDTSKTLKKPDIFGRVSNDGANDFTTVMDLSNTEGVSKRPALALSSDKMVFVWEEVDGDKSLLKVGSMGLNNLATGPATDVYPAIRGKTGNSR